LLITSLTFMFDWVPEPVLPDVQREALVELTRDHFVPATLLDELRHPRGQSPVNGR